MVYSLKVNFYKTKIYGIKLSERSMSYAFSFLSCCEDYLLFKFLDMNVGYSPRRLYMWKDVISNIRNRLSTWKSRYLSMGGRVVLINVVLNSIPIYNLSFYKARVKLLKKIRRIQSNFLWGGCDNKRKIHWVNWDSMFMYITNHHMFNKRKISFMFNMDVTLQSSSSLHQNAITKCSLHHLHNIIITCI